MRLETYVRLYVLRGRWDGYARNCGEWRLDKFWTNSLTGELRVNVGDLDVNWSDGSEEDGGRNGG